MRKLVFVPLLATLLAFGAPTAALAATPAPQATTSAQLGAGLVVNVVALVAGTATDAVVTITNVRVVNGVLTAIGTITVGNVVAPFSVPLTIVSGTCSILTLHVGAIDLNLLGLRVQVAPIDLTITAIAAPGNLLGNLLCAVAHLLDNPSAPLNAIAALLNRIIGAL